MTDGSQTSPAERLDTLAENLAGQFGDLGCETRRGFGEATLIVPSDKLLDVATALMVGRATLRKMRQNLGWAIGYNAIALLIFQRCSDQHF